jgi:hypothetical protein
MVAVYPGVMASRTMVSSDGFVLARCGTSLLACLLAIVALEPGCAETDDGGAAPGGVVGGWSNAEEHRFLCVAPDGRMWLGDSVSEIGGSSSCTLGETDAEFQCEDPDEGSTFGGTLVTEGDSLTLEITACGDDASDCRATYSRDTSVTCDDS